jgi:ATP phosphoribosyltransferase
VTEPLIIAIPSKGRLKEQVEAWLDDCGIVLTSAGGARGYQATLDGFDDVQVQLASAADIARALVLGDVHLGITGEDLLGEASAPPQSDFLMLLSLGFGRADLVVAAPKSWLDVETMADVDDVAHHYLLRTGRRLRVATKYLSQTRAFFTRHGVGDYRIVESGGATEGAPAAGSAELVVDITTSGATLAANGLKVLTDGLILHSEARLAASLRADWGPDRLERCRKLLSIVEARARGRTIASLGWPAEQDHIARRASAPFARPDETAPQHGALVPQPELFAAALALGEAGVGPISVTHPAYVFSQTSPAADRLEQALKRCD